MKNKTKVANNTETNSKIGAPAKGVHWPSTLFTIEQLCSKNSSGTSAQCSLSLRNKVKVGVEAGEIYKLVPKFQANGGVGRPKEVFVLKENFDKEKMTLLEDRSSFSFSSSTKTKKIVNKVTVKSNNKKKGKNNKSSSPKKGDTDAVNNDTPTTVIVGSPPSTTPTTPTVVPVVISATPITSPNTDVIAPSETTVIDNTVTPAIIVSDK